MRDARLKLFTDVIFEEVSRFSRDVGDLHQMKRELDFLGIQLHAAQRGKVGNLEAALYGFVSADQRESLRDATTKGRTQIAEEGRVPSGPCYGYIRLKGGRGYTAVHEPEAAVVRRIYDMYDQGILTPEIVRILNEEKVPAPRGRHWTIDALIGRPARGSGMLRNPRYRGSVIYNRTETRRDPTTYKRTTTIRHEDLWTHVVVPELIIVPPDQWDRVQDRLALRSAKGAARRSWKETIIFKGLYRCSCGANMIGCQGGSRFRSLFCSAVREGVCEHRGRLRAFRVEREIIDVIVREVISPEAAEVFCRTLVRECARIREETTVERSRHGASIDALLHRLRATFDEALTVNMTPKRLADLRSELEEELAKHEEAVASLPEIVDIPDLSTGTIEDFRKAAAELVGRLPIVAKTEPDLALVARLRDIVRQVEIERNDDHFVLHIDADLGGVSGGGSGVLPPRRFTRKCELPAYREPRTHRPPAEAGTEYEAGVLNEAGWIEVEPFLGELHGWGVSSRTVFDAALIHARTGTPMYRLPGGYRSQRIGVALRRFGRSGALKSALDRLIAIDHPAMRGIERDRFLRWTRLSARASFGNSQSEA